MELKAEANTWAHHDARELRCIELGMCADTEGIRDRIRANNEHSFQAWKDAEALLSDEYLTGVSSVVRQTFCDAITNWRRKSDASINEFTGRFACLAYLLTNATNAIREITAQPVCLIQSSRSATPEG